MEKSLKFPWVKREIIGRSKSKGKYSPSKLKAIKRVHLRLGKRGARKTKRSGVVSSSIPGKVISISVVKEDLVSEGDVIMILEAMKMQNEIQAPISGKISELNCGPGDSIEANSPLLVIEPPSDE
jgi:biotin carboxyl carrier protein